MLIRPWLLNPLLVMLMLAMCTRCLAQGPDPFGGGEPSAPLEPILPGDGGEVRREHPVVSTIRDQNPTTPVELMKAVMMLMDIDQPDEAKKYLQKLLATGPSVDQLVQLQREFGSATFLRLARYEQLLPEGRELSLAVLDAAYAAARDPKRLADQVRQLSDPSLGISRAALSELRRAGVAALPVMIQALADPARSGEHGNIRDALVALGNVSVEPLIGMLEAPEENSRLQAINVLGRLQARRAVLYLVGPYLAEDSSPRIRDEAAKAIRRIVGTVPSQTESEQFLFRRAKEYYGGTSPRQVESDGTVELWHWNAAAKTSLPVRYPVGGAALIEAARTADQLNAMAPGRVDYRRLFLASILQSDKLIDGLQRPLARGKGTAHDLASSMGVDAVLDTLDFAVKTDHVPAAIGAVEVLGDIGDASLLQSNPGSPGPVAQLLRHRDRRLQFAAAKTILEWDPKRPYPGASHLVDALQHFAATTGETSVVVGHARIEQAQSLIAVFSETGMTGESTSNGRDLFRRVVSSPDVEIILISDSVDYPEMNELVQMLRKDPRSASLPIGLLARGENLRRTRRIAERDDLTVAFPWPRDDAETAVIRGQLTDVAGARFIGHTERLNQAWDSLDALVKFAAARDVYSFYDVLRVEEAAARAFHIPELTSTAANLLGLLATQKAQLALVDFASQTTRDLKQRQAAAEGFRAAVERRRLLLTTQEILRQYDRYNASATLDEKTQQVLGSILDTIEQSDRKKTTDSKTEADESADSTS